MALTKTPLNTSSEHNESLKKTVALLVGAIAETRTETGAVDAKTAALEKALAAQAVNIADLETALKNDISLSDATLAAMDAKIKTANGEIAVAVLGVNSISKELLDLLKLVTADDVDFAAVRESLSGFLRIDGGQTLSATEQAAVRGTIGAASIEAVANAVKAADAAAESASEALAAAEEVQAAQMELTTTLHVYAKDVLTAAGFR